MSDYLTWQMVKSFDYPFPEGFDDDAKDFVTKLLVLGISSLRTLVYLPTHRF